MAEIHDVAKEITAVVGEKLYKAMQFPDAKRSHPEGFYAGPHNIEPNFKRQKDGWLEKQGYKIHETTYTYTNTWDKVALTAAFYVPNNLETGDKAPIMWFFHGGGYVSIPRILPAYI